MPEANEEESSNGNLRKGHDDVFGQHRGGRLSAGVSRPVLSCTSINPSCIVRSADVWRAYSDIANGLDYARSG